MATTTMHAGDWTCSSCGNLNYASRVACNRCHLPKEGGSDIVAGYQAQLAAQLNSAQGIVGLSAQSRGSSAPKPKATVPRPGDWYCSNPGCMNLNYASRVVCHRCHTPAFSGNPQMAQQLAQQLATMAAWGYGAVPMVTMPGKAMRVGDWMCAVCNNHNYASRTACNKCQVAKEIAASSTPSLMTAYSLPMATVAPVGRMRPGDWMCAACNNHNYASRQKCNRCQAAKPEGMATTASPY